jgi:hypothetical protein
MEFEVHFVHSPSASGKTTFLKTGNPGQLTIRRSGDDLVLPNLLYRHGNCGIVDGDDIIHYTIGWPTNKAWWKQRGATYVHAAQLFALINSAMRIDAPSWMNDLIIMFNGGMKQLATGENLYAVEHGSDNPVTLHHHTMVPSREDHERNIESRRAENLKEGRSWTFPADWGDAHNNRKSVETLAEQLGIPVHTSFIDVLKGIDPEYTTTKTESIESPSAVFSDVTRRQDPSPVPKVFYDFGTCGVKVSIASDPTKGEAHGFEFYDPPPSLDYWWKNYDTTAEFTFIESVTPPKGKVTYLIERTGFERKIAVHLFEETSMVEFVSDFESEGREIIVLSVEL